MDERDETASDPAFLCTGITAARASLKLQKGQTGHEPHASFHAADSPVCGRWFYFFSVYFILPALYLEFARSGPASVVNFCSTVLSFYISYFVELTDLTHPFRHVALRRSLESR